MKTFSSVRKKGFTLVELLIVIMIIAILSGMMMLSTGSATDGAESIKVINDLRNLKGAALMFYMDNNSWPTGNPVNAAVASSLDRYMDRSFIATNPRYAAVWVTSAEVGGIERTLIGVTLTGNSAKSGVQQKLAGNALQSGLYSAPGAAYTAGGLRIGMNMN
ncbi:MAG: type II secretion system GspH family protein [Synergistaceae bacterium]|nr:type II secretion system GspH family protein [Synergistaceae bacterium]